MELQKYRDVQNTAKLVHSQLSKYIKPESTEQSIAIAAKQIMAQHGIVDTWYHNIPALVLLGSRSCLSISGRHYRPANEKVGSNNLVTVDLSPMLDNIWGDCARSYYIEEGQSKDTPKMPEFVEGFSAQQQLHERMKAFAKPTTLFCELFEFGNAQIEELGFKNLDFLNNLGHSIETNKDNRRFIDKDCHKELASVKLFTFEPHICSKGKSWGFKHENIYYFDNNGFATEL